MPVSESTIGTNKRNELPRNSDPTTSLAGQGQIVTTLFRPRGPQWVNRVVLAVNRPLPVLPGKQTYQEAAGMSQRCQFRNSPLTEPPNPTKAIWCTAQRD